MAITQKSPGVRTPRQQIAMYLLKHANGNQRLVSKAFIFLQNERNAGQEVPEYAWMQVVKAYIRLGLAPLMEAAYLYIHISGKEIPRDQFLACGRNAIKNGYLPSSVYAYTKAEAKIPRKKIFEAAETLVLKKEMSVSDMISLYQLLEAKLPESILQRELQNARATYNIAAYVGLCEFSGIEMEKSFLEECFNHYASEYEYNLMLYVAELRELNKKISNAFMLNFVKSALTAGKVKNVEAYLNEAFGI